MMLSLSELIHPTAVIGSEVELAPDVVVGPYAILEGAITVGPGCVVEGHACLNGPLTMGTDNFVGHGAVLGKSPQHMGYRGEPTRLRIGDKNVFREHVTVHRGTPQGGGDTWIGDRNLFMIGSHVGHDVRVGDGCILVNGALVAGHVTLQDGCVLSGHAAVQQRVRIGRLAMLGGLGSTTKDIPPFVLQLGIQLRHRPQHDRAPPRGDPGRLDRLAPRGLPHPLQGPACPEYGPRLDRGRPGDRPRSPGVRLVHPRCEARHQSGEGRGSPARDLLGPAHPLQDIKVSARLRPVRDAEHVAGRVSRREDL